MPDTNSEEPEYSLDDQEKKFGKKWDKFSAQEKEESIKTAKEIGGGMEEALRHPVIMRFFFETGGEAKWGKPNFDKAFGPNETKK